MSLPATSPPRLSGRPSVCLHRAVSRRRPRGGQAPSRSAGRAGAALLGAGWLGLNRLPPWGSRPGWLLCLGFPVSAVGWPRGVGGTGEAGSWAGLVVETQSCTLIPVFAHFSLQMRPRKHKVKILCPAQAVGPLPSRPQALELPVPALPLAHPPGLSLQGGAIQSWAGEAAGIVLSPGWGSGLGQRLVSDGLACLPPGSLSPLGAHLDLGRGKVGEEDWERSAPEPAR